MACLGIYIDWYNHEIIHKMTINFPLNSLNGFLFMKYFLISYSGKHDIWKFNHLLIKLKSFTHWQQWDRIISFVIPWDISIFPSATPTWQGMQLASLNVYNLIGNLSCIAYIILHSNVYDFQIYKFKCQIMSDTAKSLPPNLIIHTQQGDDFAKCCS